MVGNFFADLKKDSINQLGEVYSIVMYRASGDNASLIKWLQKVRFCTANSASDVQALLNKGIMRLLIS